VSVLIGQASRGESGYSHQLAGNQTGHELNRVAWYARPWDTLIRAKDRTKAELIACAMEDAIANRYIGYDQTDRLSLYIQAHAHNWSIKSIITPVECDCSSLVAVCLNCAGIPVPADVYTGNLAAACAATGMCYVLRDNLLLERSDYLLRGDILLNSAHHAAVVLSNGSRATGIRITPYPAVVNVRTYLQVRTAPDGEEMMLSGQSMRLPGGMVVAICEESGKWGRLNDVPDAWVHLDYLRR
jgi:hypothetical protein